MTIRIATPLRRLTLWFTAASLAFPLPFMPSAMAQTITPVPLALSQVPLSVGASDKPNVLLILDNSNSMDENAAGAAVGSADPSSKSEISRSVAKSIVATYTDKVNMGLMAYLQKANTPYFVHNSLYDMSFDPAKYEPTWTGNRADPNHKKFRTPNPTSPGNFLYYNVALPFYSNVNQGDAFCYSLTSNSAPIASHPDGFWDTSGGSDYYGCFSVKTGTSDVLPPAVSAAAAAPYGWSNYFLYTSFTPTDSDYAQNINEFGRFMTWNYVSRTWFADTSPGRGYLHVPIANLNAAQATKLNTKLGTSQFDLNRPTDPAYPLQNAGLTPIEGTLLTAKDYFGGSYTNSTEGITSSCYPLPGGSCSKNFVVLVTDGLPSTDKNGATITNSATALTAAAEAAKALKNAGVKTYIVGFALPYGTNPEQLDTIAVAGGTGTAYSANDQTTLNAALATIFENIMATSGAAASVATNSGSLRSDSAIYQPSFNPSDWSGHLYAYKLSASGEVPLSWTWDAATKLPDYSSRKIISYKPTLKQGIAFRWPAAPGTPAATEMDASQSASIGSPGVLNYLRGDASNEGAGLTHYRERSSKLGDIVNSSPVYVGKPTGGYADTLESSASYSAFASSKASRTPVVYVGANDGMLHGFRASDGEEVLAYVPSSVYPNLPLLATQAYAHRYYVDGSPTVADVLYGSAWHTVLVAGLNGGGQGIYALDITNPANFSETNAASLVLWEFTDRDDADLGYTYSQPAVVRMHNGKWVAIFGNGYNNTNDDGNSSATGNAVLYIVDIQTGQLIKKFDTQKGMSSSPSGKTPNGLASPAAVDADGDDIVDYIYAGDLQGNMWKFDVSDSSPSQWRIAYGSLSDPAPLFTAKMGTTPQPITEQPEIGRHPAGGYFVYFGTGKYIETGDNIATGAVTQTFYALWDKGVALGSSRTDLLKQQIVSEQANNGESWRLGTSNKPTWTGASANTGWYIDLVNSQTGNTNNHGERQVSNPVLYKGAIIFTTLIPGVSTTSDCGSGAGGWMMIFDAKTGAPLPYSPFDVNGDGTFNSSDLLRFGSVDQAASGKNLGTDANTPAIIKKSNNTDETIINTPNGPKTTDLNLGNSSGRLSWREIVH